MQAFVTVAAIVPAGGGLWGVLTGFGAPGEFADSQYRYLSGILLAMGVMFWVLVPRLETARWPFRMLCALVVVGGMARAGTGLAQGIHAGAAFALVMELGVTPALFFWRERIDRLAMDAHADAG